MGNSTNRSRVNENASSVNMASVNKGKNYLPSLMGGSSMAEIHLGDSFKITGFSWSGVRFIYPKNDNRTRGGFERPAENEFNLVASIIKEEETGLVYPSVDQIREVIPEISDTDALAVLGFVKECGTSWFQLETDSGNIALSAFNYRVPTDEAVKADLAAATKDLVLWKPSTRNIDDFVAGFDALVGHTLTCVFAGSEMKSYEVKYRRFTLD